MGMITLISSLIGFIGSSIPSLFKYLQDKEDKKHELAIMQLQMTMQEKQLSQNLEEIKINADVEELKALYATYNTGNSYIDGFNGTVRPVVTYLMMFLFIAIKIMQFTQLDPSTPEFAKLEVLWDDEDQALFSGVISFYFGSRHFNKRA